MINQLGAVRLDQIMSELLTLNKRRSQSLQLNINIKAEYNLINFKFLLFIANC